MVGCATTKTIQISTTPPGAAVDIDGRRQGKTPLSYQFIWENDTDIHYVVVNLAGFKEQTLPLARSYDKDSLAFELKPVMRSLSILVQPVPAIISINGKKLNSEPVSGINTNDLEFTQDARGKWTTYKITAERTGYKPASVDASWPDKDKNYTLMLEPMEKEFTVNTNPKGATIYFDDESQPLGPSPVTATRKFPYDTNTESYLKHTIRAAWRISGSNAGDELGRWPRGLHDRHDPADQDGEANGSARWNSHDGRPRTDAGFGRQFDRVESFVSAGRRRRDVEKLFRDHYQKDRGL